MSKLLRSNFSRLWKDIIFWLCMGGMLIYAVAYMLNASRNPTSPLTGEMYSLEHYYFMFLAYVGFFFAVIISMFVGTEYSDGTMRNKLIVGHTRTNVYLANLIVTIVASLFIMCVWFIGALLVGAPAFGFFTFSPAKLAGCFLICVLLVAAYSAINTFIAMLSSNKTVTVLISIVLLFCLIICATTIDNALKEPETISSMSGVTISGAAPIVGEQVPNLRYIGGMLRTILILLLDILPTGQSVSLAFLEMRPITMILSSVVVTVGMTALGIILFHKKDLK